MSLRLLLRLDRRIDNIGILLGTRSRGRWRRYWCNVRQLGVRALWIKFIVNFFPDEFCTSSSAMQGKESAYNPPSSTSSSVMIPKGFTAGSKPSRN